MTSDYSSNPTVFGRILEGALPAKVVEETELLLCFEDISPASEHHILVVPKRRIAHAAALTPADLPLLEEMAPLAADRGRWREAFVTNAIKLVRPVGEVRWPRGLGVDMGEGAEDVGLGGELRATIKDAESRPVTRRILERVVESLGRDIGPET